MLKLFWSLKRKSDISFQQFRDHYENSHAKLGETYLGDLLLAYKRHYILPAAQFTSPLLGPVIEAKSSGYDCLTEWHLADTTAFEQLIQRLTHPEIAPLFHADEEHFLDRNSVRLSIFETVDSNTENCLPPSLSQSGVAATFNPWKSEEQ